MPSKSGNRARGGQQAEGLAARLGSAAPRRGIQVATFLPSSELRPLRRGDEVQRFNELARAQEELTEAEADELYRYRMRRLHARAQQLRRAVDASDEQAIRRGLADFDRRLAELRRLEAVREQVGLATISDLDLTARENTVGALVSLAQQRRRGLVAGSEEPPPQPAGGVRLPEVAFAPRPHDAPVYVLAPTSIPSDSLAGRVEAVAAEGAQIRLVHDPAEIPREGPPPLILNWGSTQALPDDLVALNQPESIRVASDQVASLMRLGELAPRTVLNPQDIPLLGGERIVAKQRHGARGSGKAVLPAGASDRDHAHYDLYQQFISDRSEYRVSVLSGRVVSAYVKNRPEGSGPDDLSPDWRYERASVLPRSVVTAAREAAQRVGLDYAGVDVVEDRSSGRVYCLEANAAPGMSEDTVRSFYAHVQRALRGRATRVS
jgi:RimK-like ATP-grasp domain